MGRKRPHVVKKVLWRLCKENNLLVPREQCQNCPKFIACDSPDVVRKIKRLR